MSFSNLYLFILFSPFMAGAARQPPRQAYRAAFMTFNLDTAREIIIDRSKHHVVNFLN
nr:MAG TPA: hypothetical protein [Caudoviricetes sp.]